MTQITNPKLDVLGGYAPFCGFSLLFDNPGSNNLCQIDVGPGRQLGRIRCRVATDPELEMYASLWKGLQAIGLGELSAERSFSPLNPASYHVTVWDGLNTANKRNISEEYWTELEDTLNALPADLSESRLAQWPSLPLLSRANWNIRFQFNKLEVFTGGCVLVALLEPLDQASKDILDGIKQARAERYDRFDSKFEFDGTRYPYSPHVSLGYFWNQAKARDAKEQLDQDWNTTFKRHTKGLSIQFNSVSLYGFLDMETLFKYL
jgi:hypothetical protein